MSTKRIINLFCLLIISLLVISACDSGSGRGGSYTVTTTKTTLSDIIGGTIVADDNGTKTIYDENGDVVAYIDNRGNITDTDGNLLGYYDSDTGEITNTDDEAVCYVDDDGNISADAVYEYIYSVKADTADIILSIGSRNVVSNVESFSSIEIGDEINISSGIVNLEDYYNGVSLDSELNYNFLRPVGGNSNNLIASQIGVKTNITNLNQALGVRYCDSLTACTDNSFFIEDKLTKYTYFVGNLDTNHELQKVTGYVDTTNDMFTSLEIRVENDDKEKIYAMYQLYNGNSLGDFNGGLWTIDNKKLITKDNVDDFTNYNYQFLLDDYNQTLIYNVESEAGNETYGKLFDAVTYRYLDTNTENDMRLLNIAVGYMSPIISDNIELQKNSNFTVGLGLNNYYSRYTDPDTPNKPIIYLVENNQVGNYDNDYAIITLGNANVGLVATSNDNISIDTDPYSGIGYFRKSGSYFMEMKVTKKDDDNITLNSITRDMMNGNEIVGDNETVIVNLVDGKIIEGNYLLFAGQHLFTDTSDISEGDIFVISLSKGAVVFRKDIASLYGGSTSSVSAEVSGMDGIYNSLYATYGENQGPAIHQITSSSYNNFTTTFSSINGDNITFYIPKIDDNNNITYGIMQVQLKAGLNTSNAVSDTISINYNIATGRTTLAELNLLENYSWNSNGNKISITMDKSTISFTSDQTINDIVSDINYQLDSDGKLSYNENTGIFTLKILKTSNISISGDLADMLEITYNLSNESE